MSRLKRRTSVLRSERRHSRFPLTPNYLSWCFKPVNVTYQTNTVLFLRLLILYSSEIRCSGWSLVVFAWHKRRQQRSLMNECRVVYGADYCSASALSWSGCSRPNIGINWSYSASGVENPRLSKTCLVRWFLHAHIIWTGQHFMSV